MAEPPARFPLFRVAAIAGRIALALTLTGVAVWCFGAMWFQGPEDRLPRLAIGGALALLFVAGAIGILFGQLKRFAPPLAIVGMAVAIWWNGIRPSDIHVWTPDVSRRPVVTRSGDTIEMQNVRAFRWTDADNGEQRWETRRYNLAGLRTLDLFLSTWGDPDIAHTIVSFGFADGQQIAFSIEIRKEMGEAYDTLAGFFRKYEVLVVAADESDVVKVRANKRDETVRRYRIDVQPQNARKLFDQYLAMIDRLDAAPEFYNTLTTNCTTAIFAMLRTIEPQTFPFDRRVLISGRVPDYLYDIGFISRALPLEETKRRADITARSKAAEDAADYSAAIRRE